jgi:hypothetical protein
MCLKVKLKIEDTSDIVFKGSMYNDKYLTFLPKQLFIRNISGVIQN